MIVDFAKRIEKEEAGGVPMYRHSWCIPADARADKKKDYINTEFPAMTAEEMVSGKKSKSSDYVHPGRGHLTLPSYAHKKEGGDCAYRCCSMYIKRIPDMFVIDLDEKDKCNENNPLYRELLDSNCPYTKTAKGYHFYIYLDGSPADITNTLSVQKVIDPIDPTDGSDSGVIGAMDLLGRKHPSAYNCIEAEHHELVNHDAPFPHFQWEEFSKNYLNVAKMMGGSKGKKDLASKRQKKEANAIVGNDAINSALEASLFQGYIDRLSKEGNKRYDYDTWKDVGIICWNNFDGEDEGFTIWMNWTHQDPLYKKDDVGNPGEHSYRNLSEMQTKWAGFTQRETPLTWKTLRMWANEDDPHSNVYQELYDARGHNGLMEYMNEFLAFNNKTSEVIYMDPLDRSTDARPTMKKPSDMVPVFDCFQVKMEMDKGDGTTKTKSVNPFNYWMKASQGVIRRNVCGVTFMPRNCPENYFNMFDGFDIDKRDVSDWSLEDATEECSGLLNHIRYIWCKGNDEYYNFIIGWFAHILQRPHIKVGCLICVKSKEGGGKGIVFDFMRTILGGRLYRQVNDIKHITGDWNAILEGALLINGDEVVWGGDIVKGNTLKGLITEPEVTITEKNVKAYKIKNTTAFAMSSNEDRCMSSREGDRRSFGLELEDTWSGRQKSVEHKQYFCNISGSINSSQGIAQKKAEAFAKYLFEWDLTEFNPADSPLTDFVSAQIMKNWHPVEKWWFRVLQVARFDIEDKHRKPTRFQVDGEFGPKTIEEPFEDAQLIYGNIGGRNWGNGIYEVDDIITKTTAPLQSCAYYTSNRHQKQVYKDIQSCSPSSWSLWKKLAEAEGFDALKVPMPLSFIKEYERLCGYIRREDKASKNTLRDYPWACNPLVSHTNRSVKSEYHDAEFDPAIGMPFSAIQDGGKFPEFRSVDNTDKDDIFFSQLEGIKQDWQMDSDDPYGSVVNRQAMRFAPGKKYEINYDTESDEEDDEGRMMYELAPENYVRLGAEGAWKCSDRWEPMEIVDRASWDAYINKWKDGVNEANFSDDLVWNTWNDRNGEKFCHTTHSKKVQNYLYDKRWVYEKFQQSVGKGYGAQNVSYDEFFDKITTMLGGKYIDNKGGLYLSQRLRVKSKKKKGGASADNEDRKQYWRFVGLEPAREKFVKWAGRLVDWGDAVVDEDIDDDAFGY